MKQRETLIRKIIPVEPFDMAGLEHWLSDMAAQGLHLVKLNRAMVMRWRSPPESRSPASASGWRSPAWRTSTGNATPPIRRRAGPM